MIRHSRLARSVAFALVVAVLLVHADTVTASAASTSADRPPAPSAAVSGEATTGAAAGGDLVGTLESLIPEQLRTSAAPLVDLLRQASASPEGYVGLAKLSMLLGFATVVLRLVSRTVLLLVRH